jgi:hypothetical protein
MSIEPPFTRSNSRDVCWLLVMLPRSYCLSCWTQSHEQPGSHAVLPLVLFASAMSLNSQLFHDQQLPAGDGLTGTCGREDTFPDSSNAHHLCEHVLLLQSIHILMEEACRLRGLLKACFTANARYASGSSWIVWAPAFNWRDTSAMGCTIVLNSNTSLRLQASRQAKDTVSNELFFL